MKLLSGVKEAFRATMKKQNPTNAQQDQQQQPQHALGKNDIATNIEKGPAEGETFSDNAQAGVLKVEAAAMVWGKKDLIAAYAFIWLIFVADSLQEVVVRVLTPFVTSTFGTHSLTATMNVVSNIVGGLIKIPLAKVLDTWGRPQGLTLMMVLMMLGFVLMAACKNVTTYAAAQVFYTVGAQGLSYCVTIFVSDTTSLKNRSLMLSIAGSPYIFTTWSGGPIASAALSGAGWRWGLGVWAVVTPVVVLPFCGIFFWNQHKARKLGFLEGALTIRDLSLSSIWKYCIDVDLAGIFILAAGMTLFLLPMNIYSMQGDGWRSPMIISMIIIGGLLIIAFVFYERFLAPVTFIPYNLLVDRSMLYGGLFFMFLFFNNGVWGSYFSSMLMVVWNQSVANTTYINNIYRTGSSVFAIIIGLFIRWTGRYKPFALYFFMPLMMLGVGLMIHFRQPDQSIGYVIMTQIFVAFAGGPLVECGQMCMMAVADHQHIAVSFAVLSLFGSIGSAIGSTVSAAIWTGTFKKALERHVPKTVNVDMVYSSLYAQLSYPPGTPERLGIAKAYGDAQKIMCITSVAILTGCFASIVMWRNLNVKTIKQTRGNII